MLISLYIFIIDDQNFSMFFLFFFIFETSSDCDILESRKWQTWQNMVENNVFCLISKNCINCINAMIFSRQVLPLMFTL